MPNRKKEPLARTLGKELGLTVAQTIQLLQDPNQFAVDYITKLKLKHLREFEAILTNLERLAKTGKTSTAVNAAKVWLQFMEIRNMKNHSEDSKNHSSEPVETAVKWLPGPTIEAQIIKE